MYCQAPLYGRVQVTNANVYDIGGKNYRRHGIGMAIRDLVERDVRADAAAAGSFRSCALSQFFSLRPRATAGPIQPAPITQVNQLTCESTTIVASRTVLRVIRNASMRTTTHWPRSTRHRCQRLL
jgi:hypothetical protein